MRPIFTANLLARDPSELAEQDFQFEGTLLVCGDSATLRFGNDESEEVRIVDPTFVDRMLSVVPCYVGGECLYDDAVQFRGRLSLRDGTMAISAVESGKLSREDEGDYTF